MSRRRKVRASPVAMDTPRAAPRAPRGLVRYVLVGVATVVLVGLFFLTRPGWDPMHAWNRAFADASLLLLAVTLAPGPLARLSSAFAPLIPWRREIGNWSVFAALGHVYMILSGWVTWDLSRLFVSFNDFRRDWALDQGFALGNLLGILALLYGFVLLATSNDASVRLLGSSSWKYAQQGVYVLYVLVALHTGYFLFLHFVTFHRPPPPTNWMQAPFLIMVVVLFVLQTAVFLATVRRRRRIGLEFASG